MSRSGPLEDLKPFLWLALAAFLVGFISYVALGRPHAAARAHVAYVPVASAPASEAWNLPKRI